MRFTERQLKNFEDYERVRLSGTYNMIVSAGSARRAAGLFREDYVFVMKNYSELKEAYEQSRKAKS